MDQAQRAAPDDPEPQGSLRAARAYIAHVFLPIHPVAATALWRRLASAWRRVAVTSAVHRQRLAACPRTRPRGQSGDASPHSKAVSPIALECADASALSPGDVSPASLMKLGGRCNACSDTSERAKL